MNRDIVDCVDHLVYATPSLQEGIERLEALLGVAASPGGAHPGRGTRNALLSLGGHAYLEIIAPDPEQPEPPAPRPFGIDALDLPRLVTWAARTADIERSVAGARERGFDAGAIFEMSRDTPAGDHLQWRLTRPPGEGSAKGVFVVPFLIDWGTTPHPASTAVAGGRLVDLRASSPRPSEIEAALAALELPLAVDEGPTASLEATIEGARGIVRLA